MSRPACRPSPLPNRVLPDGRIVAMAARGLVMGNRGGRIHDDTCRIVRRQASRRWIICLTVFKGRRRAVMGQGYTELFFLDEATALAAGHRPCFECRRSAALAYAAAIGTARADDIDRLLAAERSAAPVTCDPGSLPRGAMASTGSDFWLALGLGRFALWTPQGYVAAPMPAAPAVLRTPPGTCRALATGYRPILHPSALALEAR